MEKKMLNVAWLNGATPIGKGGGASSGGSGSGSGSGDDKVIYYKLSEPYYLESGNMLSQGLNFFSGARGFYDKENYGYYYGTINSIDGIVGIKFSAYGYVDAFEFRPVQFIKSGSDQSIVIYNDFESIVEVFHDWFGGFELSRITAEEYWEHFNGE